MKKITLLFLVFTVFNFYAQDISQDISMVKSEIFKDTKRKSELLFSLEDENGSLVTIRGFYGGYNQDLQGYYIQYFDENLKLVKEREYEIDDNHIRNAFIKNGQLCVIEYELNKKEKKIFFNALTANLSDLEFSKKELFSISDKKQKKYAHEGFNFSFAGASLAQLDADHAGQVVLSANNNYFVVNFDIKNKKAETHKILVFNTDFEKQYEKVIQKDIKDKFFYYQSIDVDDKDGTVYFLGRVYDNKSQLLMTKGESKLFYELYKVNKSGITNVSFKTDDKIVHGITLVNVADKLACIGLYGNKKHSRINGAFLFKLNAETLAIENEKYTPFSDQFLEDKYGDNDRKKEKSNKNGMRDYIINSVHVMSNGDIVVNAEEYYKTSNMDTSGSSRRYYTYHFDDIMSIRMDSEGNLVWARNINKAQTGLKTSSFTSISLGNDSYFLINCSDNIKKLSDDRILFRGSSSKKANLYVIKINENGNVDFNKLIDDEDSEVYYRVNNGNVNLNKKSVILTGKRKKYTRILKLKF